MGIFNKGGTSSKASLLVDFLNYVDAIHPDVNGNRGILHGEHFRDSGDLLRIAKKHGVDPMSLPTTTFAPPYPSNPSIGASVAPSPTCAITGHSSIPLTFRAGELLLQRLRKNSIPQSQLDNMHIHVGSEVTKLFVVKPSGEHVVLEDATAMFPSDSLVAAFHLLLKN